MSLTLERGSAIHRLLEILPGLPAVEREAAARRYLSRMGANWAEGEREHAWRSVSAILDDARFAGVFAPGSRPEVVVMGTLEIGGRRYPVSGKIDRLAVTADQVLILDYKTNRPPPRGVEEIYPAYIAQLALYRALLRQIYPDREVAAALLFTEAPVLIEPDAASLDAALARLDAS